jgi:hypothetical protein
MLGIKYYRYGLELLQKLMLLIQNQPLQQSYRQQGGLSKYFPKVTLCDFEYVLIKFFLNQTFLSYLKST